MREEDGDVKTLNGYLEANDSQDNKQSQTNGKQDDGENGPIAKPTDTETTEEQTLDTVFPVTIVLPHQPYKIQVPVSLQGQVQDLRSSIVEQPDTFQYTCFHLEHNGQRINDFSEISDIKDLAAESEIRLIEDPYTEREARMHVTRIREIIGAAGDRVDTLYGITAGLSLHESVSPWNGPDAAFAAQQKAANSKLTPTANPIADFDFDSPASVQTLIPPSEESIPKTIKGLCVSPWNPPPPSFRQRGHLLYLQLTTNEGEQFQITSHISGFFINKSSNIKFDPLPKASPKDAMAHSLLTLMRSLSPSFRSAFDALLELNSKRDPLATFQLTSAIPANPWLVSSTAASATVHQSDLTRTQETYLFSGVENAETLRDWNEEIQSTRELPRQTVQDRVFRERLIAKLFAEFNDAAARGAVLVARGEVAPLNPTESKEAQIFVYNNIFYSYGADGVGTFTSEGGDEAARIAVGKDVVGVKSVNQLDIPGLATPGTIIVDYLGKRLVAQTIVPGIFKQREPDEPQVDYGGVEGKDVVADNEAFVATFSQVSKALRVKKHPVWDKEGKKHLLEASVETKGLLGTDGRKYILDLYRLTPLDISWLEPYWTDSPGHGSKPQERNYPHRMSVFRPELVEACWRAKMGEYVKAELDKRKKDLQTEETATAVAPSNNMNPSEQEDVVMNGTSANEADDAETAKAQNRVDISAFSFSLNPDVFCGQSPQTAEEVEEWTNDERDVREVADHLHQKIIPELIHDLKESEVGFPMDGQSLSRLMHKRGINIRYIGKLATLAATDNPRLQALKALAEQEMIARAFKHVANRFLKDLPPVMATSCLAHLLNCLLGCRFNASPKAQLDEDMQYFYKDADYSFKEATPKSVQADVEAQAQLRYRYTLEESWLTSIRPSQLLREIAMKLGLQLVAKDYQFSPSSEGHPQQAANELTNGHAVNGAGGKKKKKRNGGDSPPPSVSASTTLELPVTFVADDIVNVVPVVKDSSSKSVLAEEALEAGRISMMQNQKELGQELLLESLSLHEQIYGILHPEVARVYHQLAMFYYNLDEKDAAVELAHKAVVISERTLGIDSDETILSYLNLSLFEHANHNTAVALRCMRHALELWKIIYGPSHPDYMTSINNAAVMLQHLKFFHESRLWFEKSHGCSEEMYGKDSVSTATLAFQLAQALALDQDHKGAVNRMKEARSIFNNKLGADDRHTKEADSWLEQLTVNAVSIAKHAKDIQAQKIRRALFTPRVTLRTQPQAPVGRSSNEAITGHGSQSVGGLDDRSIDELMRYIESSGDSSRKTPTKKQKNPRSRRT
ncbi:MAG: hypothetical protein L6R37_005073 [Teloschistes peruensis]|nr:MAG: hypothetical protein L6R37_005073 [Teloschistes peruensis]